MQFPTRDSLVRDRRARIVRVKTPGLFAMMLALLMLDVVSLAYRRSCRASPLPWIPIAISWAWTIARLPTGGGVLETVLPARRYRC
jgi:hypothetical protein